MIYGYCRATTEKQIKDGYLEEQREQITDRYFHAVIKTEDGTDINNVAVLDELLGTLTEDDVFVVTKLDRFSKNINHAVATIQQLRNRGVKIHVLNLGLIDDSTLGKVIMNNLLAYEDFEKALLVERTQGGKSKAKRSKNFKEGRPKKYTDDQIQEAVELLKLYSYKKVEEMTGISKSTLIRGKRQFSNKK